MPNESGPYSEYLEWLAAQELSILEQAEVLRMLHDIPAAHRLCRNVAKTLHAMVHPEWIMSGDLAEVFAVLDALHYYEPVSGNEIAAIARRLLRSEVATGGPYKNRNGSVSLRANAYVANCMAWLAAPLPNLEQFLRQAIAVSRPTIANMVVICRTYPLLVHRTLPRLDGDSYGKTLLAHYAASQASSRNKPSQLSAFPATPTDVTQNSAVGLALFIAGHAARQSPLSRTQSTTQLAQAASIARGVYQTLPQPVRSKALDALDRLLAVDSEHEITLLPHFFATSWQEEVAGVPPTLLSQLGAANIHSWLAYTIYDDFIDDEGQPSLLPVANIALRAAVAAYQEILPDHQDFQLFVAAAFMAVDAANSWETTYWRLSRSDHSFTLGALPNFKDRQILADRALLHIVGPVAVLAANGKTAQDTVWQRTIEALRHYLIARQLTDDLHDWTKDLRTGHISYIVAEVLRSLSLANGVYRFDQVLPAAREHFWQYLLPSLCQTTNSHLRRAREGLQGSMKNSDNHLFYFLDKLEGSMQEAMSQRQQSQDFLRTLAVSGDVDGLTQGR